MFYTSFPNFNSTIVRLKVSKLRLTNLSGLIFQFYDSTIKSPNRYRNPLIFFHFNSTIVRLKAMTWTMSSLLKHNFNSTIVRLKANVVVVHVAV